MDNVYRPSPRSLLATRLWSAVFGVLVLLCLAGVVWAEDSFAFVSSLLALGVVGAVFAFAVYTAIQAQTQRITWDSQGLTEQDRFRRRHIPWASVARFERENSAAARQAAYDKSRRVGSSSKHSGMRPRDIWVWVAMDANGQPLLRVIEPDHDEQHAPFERLRERIAQHLRLNGGELAVASVEDEDKDEDEDVELTPEQQREIDAAFDAHRQHASRMGRGVALAVLLPLLLLALYATWNAAWYAWLAPRAEGRVVEHIVTGKDKGLVQLVIAWRTGDGAEQRLKTSGTRGHAQIAVGTPITVHHDPTAPDAARPALFFEVWLWALIAWGLFVVMAAAFALITGALGRFARRPPLHSH